MAKQSISELKKQKDTTEPFDMIAVIISEIEEMRRTIGDLSRRILQDPKVYLDPKINIDVKKPDPVNVTVEPQINIAPTVDPNINIEQKLEPSDIVEWEHEVVEMTNTGRAVRIISKPKKI